MSKASYSRVICPGCRGSRFTQEGSLCDVCNGDGGILLVDREPSKVFRVLAYLIFGVIAAGALILGWFK